MTKLPIGTKVKVRNKYTHDVEYIGHIIAKSNDILYINEHRLKYFKGDEYIELINGYPIGHFVFITKFK